MDAYNLVARLTLDTSEYDKALGRVKTDLPETANELDKASSSAEKFGSKVGYAFKVAAAAIGAAVTAAATGAGALVKQSVDAYANYQQLVGGVETLFSSLDGSVSSSATVLENAANAYKTAGMSANEYMETVTSFSAALVAGLDNDYQKAAEVSDMAIRDMSDNANKMGTSLQSIQNAYQGFAKQNYMMLDNLKLGYGGTKTEMERLLADAEKFSGIHYDISNLADVYNAIHVIQEQMGITGTTAQEASDTISGSFGQIGAAWENLVTGFADKEADLEQLIKNVVDTAEISFTNLLPVIENAISGVASFVEKIAPVIAEKLPNIVNEILPPLLETADTVVNSLVESLPTILETVISVVPKIITDISQTVIELLPEIAKLGLDLINSLASGITDSIPALVPAVTGSIKEIANTLTDPQNLKEILNSGLELVTTLADSLSDAIPELVEAAYDIIENLYEFIVDPENLLKIGEAAIKILDALRVGLINAIPKALEGAAQVVSGIIGVFTGADWNGMGSEVMDTIAQSMQINGQAVIDSFSGVLGVIDNLFGTNLQQWYKDITDWSKKAGASIYDALHPEAQSQLRSIELEGSLKNTIDDYILQGKSAADAYKQAITDTLLTSDDYDVFEQYLNNTIDIDYVERRREELMSLRAEEEKAQKALYLPTEALRQQAGETAPVIKELTSAYKEGIEEISNLTEATVEKLGIKKIVGEQLSDAQKEIDSLAKETYSALKQEADRDTKYKSLSYDEQVALWQNIQSKFIEGSEQYLNAEEKIFDIRQAQIKESEKLAATAEKAAEEERKAAETAAKKAEQEYNKELKARETALKQYEKNVEKIWDNIDKLEKTYNDTFSKRTEDIYNSYSLFAEVPDRVLYSGEDLTKNLENQLTAMKKFYADVATLSSRGVSEALVTEIQSMGVNALDQLDALLDLSDEELKKYDTLFTEKHAFSSEIAESQLTGLREDTNQKIAEEMQDLEALSKENGEELGVTFAEAIATGIKKGSSYATTALADYVFGVGSYAVASSTTTYDGSSNGSSGKKSASSSVSNASASTRTITVNINGIQYQNLDDLAQAVSEKIQFQINREAVGYA